MFTRVLERVVREGKKLVKQSHYTLNIFTTQPFYGGLIDKAADACCVLSCVTIALIMNDEECLLLSCETVPFWLNISTTQPFLWGMNI